MDRQEAGNGGHGPRGGRGWRATLAVAALLGPPLALAVEDHELRRFLLLKTGCAPDHIQAEPADTRGNGQRFHIECLSLTRFPDGAEVLCTDPADDRSCRLVTPERQFRHLR